MPNVFELKSKITRMEEERDRFFGVLKAIVYVMGGALVLRRNIFDESQDIKLAFIYDESNGDMVFLAKDKLDFLE